MSMREYSNRIEAQSSCRRSWPDPNNASNPRREVITKLLSQDPSNYPDAPTEGIRRILEIVTGQQVPRGTPLPTNKIGMPVLAL
jgi:hypothetical protein